MPRKREDQVVVTDLSPEDLECLHSFAEVLGSNPAGLLKALVRQLRQGSLRDFLHTIRYKESSQIPPRDLSQSTQRSESRNRDYTERDAAIAGLSDAEYELARELSQEEIIIAHQTGGLKPYLAKLQSHAAAVEARLTRSGLNGGMPVVDQLDRIAMSRQAKLDGAA
jgi:hypothetical protein